jgi:hypothetical protein
VKKRNTKPTASKLSVLGQLCNLIPPHLVSKLARETGADSMARSFIPGFAAGRRGKRLARRFRRIIHVVDSSTIALIASCIDWAQHRRRKAAAKLHVRLDLRSLLPRFVLVESAKAAELIAKKVCQIIPKVSSVRHMNSNPFNT